MTTNATLMTAVQRLRDEVTDRLTDGELLRRYTSDRDESAFAALVRRHGGLVLGVACRQVADRHLAEDVFQATFLVLARSSAKLDTQRSLGNWLFTVALRIARKARLRESRRSNFDSTRPTPTHPSNDPLEELTGRELVRLIDDEISRLPDNYRLPLLLCCVEGLSREEAAHRLGWSSGAVKGGLERGRRRLADRLAKKGIAPAVPVIEPMLAGSVSEGLADQTMALAESPWSKAIPAGLLDLVAGPSLAKLGSMIALVAVLAIGVGVFAFSGAGQPSPPNPRAKADASDIEQSLPARSVRRFGTPLYRHGTKIQGLAVSLNGKIAVATSGNHYLGSVRSFDLTTGKRLAKLGGPGFSLVEAVGISPDGNVIAARHGADIHLYDPRTGAELAKFQKGHSGSRTLTYWISFSTDGALLAHSPAGKDIELLDWKNKKIVRTLTHEKTVYAGVFSPDGKHFAAGGYESEQGNYFVRLWDISTGKEVRRFSKEKRGLRTLAFSPDGKTLAGGGDDAQLRLWDVATGKTLHTFAKDGYRIRSVAFSSDGQTIAAAGDSIRLYDVATKKQRLVIPRRAIGLSFSDEDKILTAAVDGAIHRWDTKSGAFLTPRGCDSGIDQILVTPDGKKVISRDQAGVVHIWDRKSGKHLRRVTMTYQREMALTPDGRYLLLSEDDPKLKFRDPRRKNWIHTGTKLRLFDLRTYKYDDRLGSFEGDSQQKAFTPDGKTLVTIDHRDAACRVWDVAKAKVRRSFRVVRDSDPKQDYVISDCVLSGDGRTLAVAYRRFDNTTLLVGAVALRLWSIETGKELHDLKGHSNDIHGLAFSPDGRYLVSCAESPHARSLGMMDSLRIWDTKTGKRLSPLADGLPNAAFRVAFSPDGRTFAACSRDGSIRLWEVASWTLRTRFSGHTDRITSLAFGPNGALFSGSFDTTVLAWNTQPIAKAGDMKLSTAWDQLATTSARDAFRAQSRFLTTPDASIDFLAKQLKPKPKPTPKQITQWIDDLDSDEFDKRESSTTNLRDTGRSILPTLKTARAKTTSTEAKRRLDELIDEFESPRPPRAHVRRLRAIEVLEWIDTHRARKVIEGDREWGDRE